MHDKKQKREVLPPRLNVIEALAAQVQDGRWCIWRAVEREGGKLGKVPHQFKAGKLSPIGCNDPDEWASWATARQWYEQAGGGAAGVGILVGSNPKDHPEIRYSSGLVAVDIDNCLDDAGALSADVSGDVRQAVIALQSAGAYIEISPSGTGLRALWIGSKSAGIREKASIDGIGRELYDGSTVGRYVTLTGQVWGGSAVGLVEQSEAFARDAAEWLGLLTVQKSSAGTGEAGPRDLPPVSDDELIKKLKQSGQGRAKKLFDGDMSEYAGDHSAADAALCRLVARWSDDPAQLARVWGASALAKRPKFERKDYRERTIDMALASARKAAAEGSSAAAGKAERVKAAVAAGDSGGALASALASWGGKVPSTLGAAETILSLDKRLAAAFAFDEFCGQVVKLRSLRDCLGEAVPPDAEPVSGQTWTDADTSALTVWLERAWGISLKSGLVDEAVNLAAKRRVINTVCDSLSALVWDGRKRLDRMLVDWFNADDSHDSPRYLAAIGRAWMVGTVARAFQPGCKHDHVLTLEGGQGFGKSNAVRVLASAIAPHAYREGLPPLTQGQEAEIALCGVWVCELAELSFMDRATTEHIKAFLTRVSDSFRPKYGRRNITVGRTCSFGATTNQGTYVRDATGARRFWVFRVGKRIDIEALREVAPQLWAEAVAAYKGGESWWLTDASTLRDAEASQWRRLERDGWDELIADKLIDPLSEGKLGEPSEFYEQALNVWRIVSPEAETEFNKYARAFSDALVRSGFEKKQSGGRSMWRVSAALLGRINQARGV